MKQFGFFLILAAGSRLLPAQTGDYRLALADHKGQLSWSVDGFKIIQNSAKSNGREIGIRGRLGSGGLSFLGFLFLVPEGAPLTSTKCRDGVVAELKKSSAVKIVMTSEISRPDGLPVALLSYNTSTRGKPSGYSMRAFVASEDTCGDLEFYSETPISEDDGSVNGAFRSFQLTPDYTPQFSDVATYAQVLFQTNQYKAAAPMFERALQSVPANGAPFPSAKIAKRILRDQSGMAYGISGDFVAARRIFEQGIAEDPDYPMYYYNLACADAGEQKLTDARKHLQQAFDRQANVNPGEQMPVPTEDDSFTPFKDNKEFWAFIERIGRGK